MAFPKWPVSTDRELELIRQVLESERWGGYHEFVTRLEGEFAAFQHCAHGISAANGTLTLEMALLASGVGPGDEVIVPAISFVSTATAVSRVGAVPVFVDIEEYTFNMDPDRAAAAVSARTKAIIPVHFGGAMADMDRLMSLARERGLAVIEDAAHAHGSEWRGRRAGSYGLTGSFSFQNSKVMTAGEGGMLTTNDPGFAERAHSIANQGRRTGGGWFHHYILGSNFRLSALQAAVLLAQLERLPEQIRQRTCNAQRLCRELADLPGITWQRIAPEANVHSYYLLLGRIDSAKSGYTRDKFQKALAERGITCTYYPHPLYANPVYQTLPCRAEPCPVAEATIQDAFWLSHRLLMGNEADTLQVAEAVRAAARV
ncbi:MAG: DegT/DnrJ/EryC1/StrS family aminotransferase [Bryobacterales bacterium]|nr:DegT/DnrJ/EryC1/StrS family aminotransferase [Bryobacterales bacterium]